MPSSEDMRHVVTVEVVLTVEGSAEEADAIRDRVVGGVMETFDVYCGDPECCPAPRPARPYVSSGAAFSTVMTEDEYARSLDEQD